jgi:hypothetical protein
LHYQFIFLETFNMAFKRFVALCLGLTLVASIAMAGSARSKGPQAGAAKRVTGEEIIPETPVYGGGYPSTYSGGPGDSIGYTTYDYGTNGSASRNLINYGSTIALVRMAAHDIGAGTTDRGSWRKCSVTGGNTWPGAMTKVEVLRRGWTNVADLGGNQAVVSHTGLEVNTNAATCGTTWTSILSGSAATTLWPRIATTNTDDIHIVAANNPPTDLLYARSLDGGATYDMVDVSFATAGTFVADADAYDIASDGTNIAVASAGLFGNVLLVESADNGATWSQTVIYDTDETGLTEESIPDGSVSVAYDNDGDVHVAWGTYYASGEGVDSIFFSTAVGINHWSAASGVQTIGLPPDSAIVFNEIWRDGAVATQPDLAVDDDNNMYCVYSSWINETDVYGNSYEHVMGVGSDDNGMTWSTPVDLTPGTGFDASFPSIADRIDVAGNVNLTYNCDPYAGNWLQASAGGGLHPHIAVAIMYDNIAHGDFFPMCPDVTNFIARCISGGIVQARVVFSGSTIHSGKTVEFTIGEDTYIGTVGDNGTSSRASIEATVGLGTHTISLTNPADCRDPLVRTCSAGDKLAEAEWEADEAAWIAESKAVQSREIPAETKLLGNYPNPFNPSTTIRYALNVDSPVSVKVFNMLGQEVATLFDGVQKAGEQSVVWHGRNSAGQSVASGLYFYKLQVGNKVLTEKMMFMK